MSTDDIEPLGEDVTTHCMGYWTKHDDGRVCAYHSRLDSWATSDPTTHRWTLRCLRQHDKR